MAGCAENKTISINYYYRFVAYISPCTYGMFDIVITGHQVPGTADDTKDSSSHHIRSFVRWWIMYLPYLPRLIFISVVVVIWSFDDPNIFPIGRHVYVCWRFCYRIQGLNCNFRKSFISCTHFIPIQWQMQIERAWIFREHRRFDLLRSNWNQSCVRCSCYFDWRK